MWRHVASNALTLLVLFIFVAGGVIAWAQRAYNAPGPLTEAVCLRVQPGSNMREVAENLGAMGAVQSEALFNMGAEYSGQADSLKTGSFLLLDGISMSEIVGIVTGTGRSTCGSEVNFRVGISRVEVVASELDPTTNRYVELTSFDPADEGAFPAAYVDLRREADLRYRVTLAEGVTSWQVVNALTMADFLEGAVAEQPAEGSLAPDSYEVSAGSTRDALLVRMTEAQEAILLELWQSRAADLPVETMEEALILASIVEKETGLAEERRQVASVFINRLNQGMRLQTDPTVIYGVTRGEGILGRGLRQSELRGETPWNTYVIDGLPPTPIANPGRASIEATLNPADTQYLFFVADGTGGHAFANTLSEHNTNVARWRQIEAEQGDD